MAVMSLVALLGLSACAGRAPPEAAPPIEPPLEPQALGEKDVEVSLAALAGDYRIVDPRGQQRLISAAIEEVVDKMSIFARSIARRRLAEANEVPHEISIDPNGQEVTVEIDGEAHTGRIGGPAIEVPNAEGGTSRLRYELRGSSLVQIFEAPGGDRINVFSPREDGEGLTLGVTMQSPRLPDDIAYRLAFRTDDRPPPDRRS